MSTLCSRWWRRPRPPRSSPHSHSHPHHRLIRVVVVLSIVCCHCFILLFSSSAATTSSFCCCLWSARISARRLRTGRIVNNRILLLFLLVSRCKLTATETATISTYSLFCFHLSLQGISFERGYFALSVSVSASSSATVSVSTSFYFISRNFCFATWNIFFPAFYKLIFLVSFLE